MECTWDPSGGLSSLWTWGFYKHHRILEHLGCGSCNLVADFVPCITLRGWGLSGWAAERVPLGAAVCFPVALCLLGSSVCVPWASSLLSRCSSLKPLTPLEILALSPARLLCNLWACLEGSGVFLHWMVALVLADTTGREESFSPLEGVELLSSFWLFVFSLY